MLPVIFSIGSFHFYSLSLFLIFSWILWSFLFWRYLRNLAVREDSIFDVMFYATIVSFFTARAFFVITHIQLFSDGWLKVIALWVQPGLSFTGGLIGGVLVSVLLSMKYKIRIAYILDGLTHALCWSFLIGAIGGFLDGSVVGKITNIPWGVVYIGHIGSRHPVQVYEIIYMVALAIFLWRLTSFAKKRSWPYGQISMWFFLLFALAMFLFEFFIESDVYWGSLSANQWIYVAVVGQAIGAFYVKGGGKEKLVQLRGILYGKFSKQHIE